MLRNRAHRLVRLNRFAESDPFQSWPFHQIEWRNGVLDRSADSSEASRDGYSTRLSPPVDIVVNDESYSLFIELPGTKREDINVALHEKVLTVTGEKKRREVEESDKLHRTERRYGSFERSFRLPTDAEEDGMRATQRDGVLSIEIPRRRPEQPRQLEIEA